MIVRGQSTGLSAGWCGVAMGGIRASQLREELKSRGLISESYRNDLRFWVWRMAADLRLAQHHPTGTVNTLGQPSMRAWIPAVFAEIAVKTCAAHPSLTYAELRAKMGPVAEKLGGQAWRA